MACWSAGTGAAWFVSYPRLHLTFTAGPKGGAGEWSRRLIQFGGAALRQNHAADSVLSPSLYPFGIFRSSP